MLEHDKLGKLVVNCMSVKMLEQDKLGKLEVNFICNFDVTKVTEQERSNLALGLSKLFNYSEMRMKLRNFL